MCASYIPIINMIARVCVIKYSYIYRPMLVHVYGCIVARMHVCIHMCFSLHIHLLMCTHANIHIGVCM